MTSRLNFCKYVAICYNIATVIDQLQIELKNAGFSLTKPRLTVFSALQGTKPKTMRELIYGLEGVIDRASVYRTISLFENLGIVLRIQHGWKYKLELSDNFIPHHHHLTCQLCQRVISFDEPEGFELMIDTIATENGFIPNSHNLEILGYCPQCSTK